MKEKLTFYSSVLIAVITVFFFIDKSKYLKEKTSSIALTFVAVCFLFSLGTVLVETTTSSDFFNKTKNKKRTSGNSNLEFGPTAKIIYYSSDSCGYCQQFNPTWNEFVDELNIKYPFIQTQKVIDSPEIIGVPTIRFYIGEKYSEYTQNREIVEMMSWVEEQLAKYGYYNESSNH